MTVLSLNWQTVIIRGVALPDGLGLFVQLVPITGCTWPGGSPIGNTWSTGTNTGSILTGSQNGSTW